MPLDKFSVRGAPSTPQLLRMVAPSLRGTERFISSPWPISVSDLAAYFSSTRPWCAARSGRLQRSCVARNNLPCGHGVRYCECNATSRPLHKTTPSNRIRSSSRHQPWSARCGSHRWHMPAAVCSNDLRLSTHGRTTAIYCHGQCLAPNFCSHVPGPRAFWHPGNTQRSRIRASSCRPRIIIGRSALLRTLRSAHRSQWSTNGPVEEILLQPPQHCTSTRSECMA